MESVFIEFQSEVLSEASIPIGIDEFPLTIVQYEEWQTCRCFGVAGDGRFLRISWYW